MKRYEKHSKRQGARANHPKQPALPERRAPRADYPTRALKADCPTRAPSAHFFRASRLLGVSFQLGRPPQAENVLGFSGLLEGKLCRFCIQKIFMLPPPPPRKKIKLSNAPPQKKKSPTLLLLKVASPKLSNK